MTAATAREIARSDTDAAVYDALAPGAAELHRSMVFRLGNAAHPAFPTHSAQASGFRGRQLRPMSRVQRVSVLGAVVVVGMALAFTLAPFTTHVGTYVGHTDKSSSAIEWGGGPGPSDNASRAVDCTNAWSNDKLCRDVAGGRRLMAGAVSGTALVAMALALAMYRTPRKRWPAAFPT